MNRRGFVASAMGLGLIACSPTVQGMGRPDVTFAGARLEDEAFVSFDGARLGLSQWLPQGTPRAVIVGLHGMNDYAAAFGLAGERWAQLGVATYAYDQRGFGRSPQRGVWGGEELMIEDLRIMVQLVRARHPGVPVAVAGVSMGGAVAIRAFASNRPPQAERLVLLAPAVWGWSNQPLPNKTLLWLSAHVAGPKVWRPPEWLLRRVSPTDNRDELIRMSRDPNMIWGARSDALFGLTDLMENAWGSLARVRTPIAYFYGAKDQIIPPEPTFEAVRRLKPQDRSAYYDQGWHLLLVDRQREAVVQDVLSFINDPAAPLPSGAPSIPGDPNVKAAAVVATQP